MKTESRVPHPIWCLGYDRGGQCLEPPSGGPSVLGEHHGRTYTLEALDTAAYTFTVQLQQFVEVFNGVLVESEQRVTLTITDNECEALPRMGRLSVSDARRLIRHLELAISDAVLADRGDGLDKL